MVKDMMICRKYMVTWAWVCKIAEFVANDEYKAGSVTAYEMSENPERYN